MNRKPLPIHGVDVTAERPPRSYRVTVTIGRARITDTVEARSWHCALMAAFDKYGVGCVVVVKPAEQEPAPRRSWRSFNHLGRKHEQKNHRHRACVDHQRLFRPEDAG